jgi:hypothetical protein
MRRAALVKAANLVLKAALAAGAIGLTVSFVSMFAKISYHPDFLEPYPTFGASWSGLFVAVAVIYGVIWLAWSGIMLWVSSYGEGDANIVVVGFVGLLMFVTYFGMAFGLTCANALLDTSPRVREPVLIRQLIRGSERTFRGKALVATATISPVNQPTRQLDLNWRSCNVKSSEPVSPSAAVLVGRGAFGVPWVELPVECRPLAVSDRPLVGQFVLGHGPVVLVVLAVEPSGFSAARAGRRRDLLMNLEELGEARGDPEEMVNLLWGVASEGLTADGQAELRRIVAPLKAGDSTDKIEDAASAAKRLVEADAERRNFGYRFSIWRKAVESAAPGLPIVVIENGFEKGSPALPCPRCTIVSADDVDKEIFGTFTGWSHPEFDKEEVFLADRAGKLAFKADLSDTKGAPELAARAKAVLASR